MKIHIRLAATVYVNKVTISLHSQCYKTETNRNIFLLLVLSGAFLNLYTVRILEGVLGHFFLYGARGEALWQKMV